jgi:hypothetical protein
VRVDQWISYWLYKQILGKTDSGKVVITDQAEGLRMWHHLTASLSPLHSNSVIINGPITVAARYNAWPVFARSNAGIPLKACVCVVLCVGRGLATGWSPAQGVLPTVYGIKKLKKRPRPGIADSTETFIPKLLSTFLIHIKWSAKLWLSNNYRLVLFLRDFPGFLFRRRNSKS